MCTNIIVGFFYCYYRIIELADFDILIISSGVVFVILFVAWLLINEFFVEIEDNVSNVNNESYENNISYFNYKTKL